MAYTPWICLLLWSVFLKDVLAGEDCFIWKRLEWEYCSLGCCGEGFDTDCCSMVGIIIGSCIGGIVLIAVIVTIICCCIKHKGKSGHVMGTNTTTVAYVGQHSTYYSGQQMQPVGYGNAPYAQPYPGTYPPPYTQNPTAPSEQNIYSDPAYPPPDPPTYK